MTADIKDLNLNRSLDILHFFNIFMGSYTNMITVRIVRGRGAPIRMSEHLVFIFRT